MEESTVSPSPASPTAGEDLCETDVSNVAMHSVTLLICLCGLAGNGAVLWLLSPCSLSRIRTIHVIYILTFLEFLFLLFAGPSTLLFLQEVVSCAVIMTFSYVSLLFGISPLFYTLWLFVLTFITIRWYRSFQCPLCHCCQHPQQPVWVRIALRLAVSIIFLILYVTWLLLCQFSLPEHCRVSFISLQAFKLLLCASLLLISSTALFIKIKSGSQHSQTKRLNIFIFLTGLFTLPLSLHYFFRGLNYTIVPTQVVFLLSCIHSSIKPFIYFLAGRCWRPCSVGSLRLSLQRVFEEPEESTARSDDPAMDTGL